MIEGFKRLNQTIEKLETEKGKLTQHIHSLKERIKFLLEKIQIKPYHYKFKTIQKNQRVLHLISNWIRRNPFVFLLVSSTALKLVGKILTFFGKVSAINGFDESLLATDFSRQQHIYTNIIEKNSGVYQKTMVKSTKKLLNSSESTNPLSSAL
ncbi:hypothetical protein H5410_045192 [Solanum commersonii]|uniref:Uncharacterized protein n=1 Tax=Solanum commersonii TaxID=4109 RepID=A0A9J5XBY8_SOLCO|nr:hypothetical protein H5410_045192 [Solanum commersonii]